MAYALERFFAEYGRIGSGNGGSNKTNSGLKPTLGAVAVAVAVGTEVSPENVVEVGLAVQTLQGNRRRRQRWPLV